MTLSSRPGAAKSASVHAKAAGVEHARGAAQAAGLPAAGGIRELDAVDHVGVVLPRGHGGANLEHAEARRPRARGRGRPRAGPPARGAGPRCGTPWRPRRSGGRRAGARKGERRPSGRIRLDEGNFRSSAVLRVGVSRLLVILMLLAATLPAAAGAQTTTPEPPVATTGAAGRHHRDRGEPERHGRSERLDDDLPLRVRHVGRLRADHAREHRRRRAPIPGPSRPR